ncbi:MAG: hypothetical protein EFT35_03095 [Methanophagales archaeon ANME-1-THS]|nr:MAG: hypothetical protein EFT35_03095 [Methanophagales archaeon ANME-1-THS]
MGRLGYLLVLILVLLVSVAGCIRNQVDITVGPGEGFTIGIGQSARITGEDMVITFEEVIGDSRCPQNVVCLWAGVASSHVRITHQGTRYSMVLNQPGLTDQAQESFINYTLTFSLHPYPRAGEAISPEEYRLTLTVTK